MISGAGFIFLIVIYLLICRISSDVQHCLAVDLKCDRTVESYLDLMTCLYLNDFLMVNVLALEDRREDAKSSNLAAAVEEEK